MKLQEIRSAGRSICGDGRNLCTKLKSIYPPRKPPSTSLNFQTCEANFLSSLSTLSISFACFHLSPYAVSASSRYRLGLETPTQVDPIVRIWRFGASCGAWSSAQTSWCKSWMRATLSPTLPGERFLSDFVCLMRIWNTISANKNISLFKPANCIATEMQVVHISRDLATYVTEKGEHKKSMIRSCLLVLKVV